MKQRRVGGLVPHVALHIGGAVPLHRQLYDAVREGIVSGTLRPGTRIASSRALAEAYGVSRFTVVSATEQLMAEGYLKARRGAGSWVTSTLPEVGRKPTAHRGGVPSRQRPTSAERAATLSQRGHALSAVVITGPRGEESAARAFRPRRPPLDIFPFTLWARTVRRQWASFSLSQLDYGDPAGYAPLREAIAEHVAATRGVRCTAKQVIVTSGAQQAFDLIARLLLDPGDGVWIEEPGYLDIRAALVGTGARLVAVPVDGQGLDVAAGVRAAPMARMAIVSPSHQYPTGVTLSAERRMALLAWGAAANAWIVEDDYDSYFRYHGRPLSSLQQLEAESASAGTSRVIYVGTFSKTMFPSLRLGYCIVPESLIEPMANARAVADRNSPIADQAALARFLREGHYDRHLRRLGMACAERHAHLQTEMERRLGTVIHLAPAAAGTHLLGWPHPRLQRAGKSGATRIADAAALHGLVIFPLARYCLRPEPPDAIILGYGGLSPATIRESVERLGVVVESLW